MGPQYPVFMIFPHNSFGIAWKVAQSALWPSLGASSLKAVQVIPLLVCQSAAVTPLCVILQGEGLLLAVSVLARDSPPSFSRKRGTMGR
jgi:hypothetical protein